MGGSRWFQRKLRKGCTKKVKFEERPKGHARGKSCRSVRNWKCKGPKDFPGGFWTSKDVRCLRLRGFKEWAVGDVMREV